MGAAGANADPLMSRHGLLVRTSLSLRRRRGIRILGGTETRNCCPLAVTPRNLKAGKHQQHRYPDQQSGTSLTRYPYQSTVLGIYNWVLRCRLISIRCVSTPPSE